MVWELGSDVSERSCEGVYGRGIAREGSCLELDLSVTSRNWEGRGATHVSSSLLD
jgi:hypothetical protein